MTTENKLPTNIVKVKYFSETTSEFSAREYTYYSEEPLQVGDIVIVPIRDTTGKAKVSTIDVPEAEIEAYKDKVKVIPSDASVGVPNRSVPNETEAVIRVDSGACLAPTTEMIPPSPHLSQPDTDLMPEPEDTEKGLESIAIIKVKPDEDQSVIALSNEAQGILRYAESRAIADDQSVKLATEDLSMIARLKKAIEEKQKEYVSPVKEHLKAIQDAFKIILTPLENADHITRSKIIAYRQEVERKVREAEEINRLRMEAARKEMALKGELTELVNLVEQPAPPPAQVRTEVGSLGTAKVWKFEVTDIKLLPDDYKLPDLVKIRKVVIAGVAIPGVKAWQEETLKINTR